MADDWLRLAGAAIPEAIIGLEGEYITFLNDRAAALRDSSAAELVGLDAGHVISSDDLDRLVALERQMAQGWDNPQTFQARLLKRGGGEVLVDLRFARTGEYLLLSARDMTETSRGERLIARIAELQG